MTKKEDKIKKQEDKIKNFADLLDSLTKTADKKKLLWKESYQNAIDDRESAHILLTDLIKVSLNNSTNHLQFGTLMSKYLERMSKSNDQILKLAELIAKEQEEAENVTPDSIYDSIMK
tara:strand:- start:161 stop:514 length:354 start_codon:yes stop_codon:yes gene_type:complete